MKKFIIVLFIALFPIMTFAKEYEVKDINIKLDVDEDYIVLTRDNLEKNSDLAKLNLSEATMKELMEKNNIYFDIIKSDITHEILVIVPDNKLKDWNNFSNANDELLNDIKALYAKQVGATESNIYKTKHNYIVISYFDAKTEYYIVNYYTVVNARGYNIQLQKKSEITQEEKDNLKKIVDSLEIEVLDEYKNESKETQDKIDNYGKKNNGFNYKTIIYGAIIGALSGLVSYLIGLYMKKKKSSE